MRKPTPQRGGRRIPPNEKRAARFADFAFNSLTPKTKLKRANTKGAAAIDAKILKERA
jgi:hypothetical protein